MNNLSTEDEYSSKNKSITIANLREAEEHYKQELLEREKKINDLVYIVKTYKINEQMLEERDKIIEELKNQLGSNNEIFKTKLEENVIKTNMFSPKEATPTVMPLSESKKGVSKVKKTDKKTPKKGNDIPFEVTKTGNVAKYGSFFFYKKDFYLYIYRKTEYNRKYAIPFAEKFSKPTACEKKSWKK